MLKVRSRKRLRSSTGAGCRAERLTKPLGKHGAQADDSGIRGIEMHLAAVERHPRGGEHRGWRPEERKRLTERDNVMPNGAQLRSTVVKWIERGQLDGADATGNARDQGAIVIQNSECRTRMRNSAGDTTAATDIV